MNISNKYALVIGGSKGLGLGTVRKLCQEGLPVLVLHRDLRKDLPQIEAEFEAIRREGGNLLSFQMDALKKESREDWIRRLPERIGDSRIGMVVYSVAKGNLKPMQGRESALGLTSRDFLLTSEAMAFGLYDWVSDLMAAGRLDQDCRVLAFTSEGSRKILPNYGAVASAKASLEAMIRHMAVEWAPMGIKANCIQAGVTDTESLRMIPGSESILEQSKERNPHRRLTTAEDVGNAVYLLSRPEAAWITGNIIRVDGGEALR